SWPRACSRKRTGRTSTTSSDVLPPPARRANALRVGRKWARRLGEAARILAIARLRLRDARVLGVGARVLAIAGVGGLVAARGLRIAARMGGLVAGRGLRIAAGILRVDVRRVRGHAELLSVPAPRAGFAGRVRPRLPQVDAVVELAAQSRELLPQRR